MPNIVRSNKFSTTLQIMGKGKVNAALNQNVESEGTHSQYVRHKCDVMEFHFYEVL